MARSPRTTRRSFGQRSVAAAAVATLAAVPAVTLATSAQAAEEQEAALIGPTFTIFNFLADFGLPTGCQLLTAVAAGFALDNGFGNEASPIIAEVNAGCEAVRAAAVDYVATGKQASQPLSAINQFANPGIEAFAAAVTLVGTDYGDVVAPFGKTIAGLGGSINFFQGR